MNEFTDGIDMEVDTIVEFDGEFITVYKGTSVPDSTVGKDGDIFVEY